MLLINQKYNTDKFVDFAFALSFRQIWMFAEMFSPSGSVFFYLRDGKTK